MTGLEEQALSVEFGVSEEMPRQFRERPGNDPLYLAWRDALDAATLARLAMQGLGDLLRKEAHITEPGPCEKHIIGEGETFDPVPEGWNLASACVDLVRHRTTVDIDPDDRTRLISYHVPAGV